jgi:4-aminobutyrate aminotransferase
MKREDADISIKSALPGPNAEKWVEAYMKHAAPSTYAYPFVWDVSEWAQGPFCTDPDGNVILDFYGRVGSAPLGYYHPRLLVDCGVPFDPVKTAEHDTFLAVGPCPSGDRRLRFNGGARDFRTATDLQDLLVKHTSKFGMDTVFLVNSGAEAVSNSIKISIHRKFREVRSRIGDELFSRMCSQFDIGGSEVFGELYVDYPFFGIAATGAFNRP